MSDRSYNETREKLLALGACDRCIGRQFHSLFNGADNGAIGFAVRSSETPTAAKKAQPGQPLLKKGCPLCNGHFIETEAMAAKASELLANLDYKTFLVGCRVEQGLLGKEEDLWAGIGAEHSEPLKKDLVRQLGLGITRLTGKDADFKNPDVMVLADFTKGSVSLDVRPLFIYGEYQKLVRGIPQTRWFCRVCRGRGCQRCNFTGKMYAESVEEIIAKPLLDESGAKGVKFHGSGREDIDATMLGWRPFVIELQSPVRRFLDWERMASSVNAHGAGKVAVRSLRPSNKDEVRFLKAVKHDKSYEAIIECENDVDEKSLRALEAALTGKELGQRTPQRVTHRRADLVRNRVVHSVTLELLGPKRIRAIIKAEAGTYIKELISGDEGRTKPSFSELLGPCKCVELNVIEVHSNA